MASLKDEPVWILTYEHKHGEDRSVYATKEDALRAAAQIICDWIDEIEEIETRNEILAKFRLGELKEGVDLWEEAQHQTGDPEWLIIEETCVTSHPEPEIPADFVEGGEDE